MKSVPEKDAAAGGTAQVWDFKALALSPEQVAAGWAAAKRRALARIPGVSDEDAVEAEWRAEITAEEDAEELASLHAEDDREEAMAEARAEWRAEITADEDAEELASIHAEDAPAPEPEYKMTAEEERAFDLAVRAWQDQAKT